MNAKSEWKKLLAIVAVFLVFFWLPVGWARFTGAISEALHLTLRDVDLDDGVLSIHQSKFRKSRLVPLSPGIVDALRRYHEIRVAVAPAGPSAAPWAAGESSLSRASGNPRL